MNEWVMVGMAIIGTLVLAGGGAWMSKVLGGKKETPKT